MVEFRKFDPAKHHRRSIRLQNWDYSSPGIYFVTMRVKKNSVFFCRTSSGKFQLNDLGRIVANSWLDVPNHYENVELDEWVVMPDHFHGLVIIKERITKNNWNETVGKNFVGAIHESPQLRNNRRKMLLSKIIGRFKMVSAKQINLKLHSSGRIWQRDYYEHVVRDKESLTRIRNYIQTNPDKLNAF
jgi:putative transposase